MNVRTIGMLIEGAWVPASDGRTQPVVNPATEGVTAKVAMATPENLDRALAASSSPEASRRRRASAAIDAGVAASTTPRSTSRRPRSAAWTSPATAPEAGSKGSSSASAPRW